MTPRVRLLIAVGGLLALAVAAVFTCCLPGLVVFFEFHPRMRAGREFMDSLTAEDMPRWIDRAERLLAASPQGAALPAPDDLKALKIQHVYVAPPHTVSFVWASGFDHTMLVIQRDSDGTHTVTACYSDEESRRLWPQ
ncbi:MAG: hypothetical protein JW809_09260 [Pirellulales bacterium]|nr:hypothetical protein [Pirellulales bacterium]